MMETAMDEGLGERLEREGQRRYARLMAIYFAAIPVIAAIVFFARLPDRSLAPWAGWVLGIGYPVFIGLMWRRTLRASDELEVHHNAIGLIFAASAYMLLYPCWMFLWMGHVAPEPNHLLIFLGVATAAMVGYFWSKRR